jgi:hypothetical protein
MLASGTSPAPGTTWEQASSRKKRQGSWGRAAAMTACPSVVPALPHKGSKCLVVFFSRSPLALSCYRKREKGFYIPKLYNTIETQKRLLYSSLRVLSVMTALCPEALEWSVLRSLTYGREKPPRTTMSYLRYSPGCPLYQCGLRWAPECACRAGVPLLCDKGTGEPGRSSCAVQSPVFQSQRCGI